MTEKTPKIAFLKWLKKIVPEPFSLTSLSGDASRRFYFRVSYSKGPVVAVDASEEKNMNHQFSTLAKPLRTHGVNVPDIFAADLKEGYLLMTDFGDHLYQSVLTPQNAQTLYQDALIALLKFQTYSQSVLPPYSERLLIEEALLFQDWYLSRHLKRALSPISKRLFKKVIIHLVRSALEQPIVAVHRDYHSRNLFWLPENNPGMVDFQDAVQGPITYDAVSLLRDCYVDWPETLVYEWLQTFFDAFKKQHSLISSFPQFIRWFDWMGLQRHLKAVGIFARLFEREGFASHLPSIPRTLGYIKHIAGKYPVFLPFKRFLEDVL
ncbi:MAG: phosphotransferase [Gammaproteobacteria bacterium]|nr:phosphotransferase [Gammaproteobacteria bacterium]